METYYVVEMNDVYGFTTQRLRLIQCDVKFYEHVHEIQAWQKFSSHANQLMMETCMHITYYIKHMWHAHIYKNNI